MYGKARKYKNKDITVFWRPNKCIHATYCYRELLKVFNPSKRPWINMEGAPTKDIIRIVDMCPTDALTYKWNKDIEKEQKVKDENKDKVVKEKDENKDVEQKTEVKVMENGPVIIKGNFKIVGTDGEEIQQMKAASICRCGYSENQPFCDGTHKKIKFKN
ncbi:MAG: (4Fe-4S)-binding protein [Bacteroidales bacterium]|nr:MAG: (4Fe-4S)-binding protein [Bacteroidales bacterium]